MQYLKKTYNFFFVSAVMMLTPSTVFAAIDDANSSFSIVGWMFGSFTDTVVGKKMLLFFGAILVFSCPFFIVNSFKEKSYGTMAGGILGFAVGATIVVLTTALKGWLMATS